MIWDILFCMSLATSTSIFFYLFVPSHWGKHEEMTNKESIEGLRHYDGSINDFIKDYGQDNLKKLTTCNEKVIINKERSVKPNTNKPTLGNSYEL